MAVGIVILVIMLARLIVRLRSAKLTPVDSNATTMNKVRTLGHYSLYALVIMMAVSGIVTAQIAGLGDIVFFWVRCAFARDFRRHCAFGST
jgi:cytochrome b561